MVGCAFVPLQFTLHVNYFLREITEKRPHAKQILFEMTNQLTTNIFHRHYTNFDRGKYRDT